MHFTDKKLWEIVITKFNYGGVVDSFSYYGNYFVYDDKKTKKLREKFSFDAVDWNKSIPLNPDVRYGFDGTFSDEDMKNSTLEGTIVFKDGTKYHYGIIFDDVTELMKTIILSFESKENEN